MSERLILIAWITASMPFWISGIVMTYIGAMGGLYSYIKREHEKAGSGDIEALCGGTVIVLFGGCLLYIAARLVS